MPLKAKGSYQWLQILTVLLIVGGSLVFLITAKTKSLDKQSLKIALIELRSQAAQGKLLAEAALDGRTTLTYFGGQLQWLQQKADTNRKELTATKSQPGLENSISKAREVAERVHENLAALSVSYGDRGKLDAIGQTLHELVKEAADLEATLM
jgi:hypothetical protein